MRFVFNNLIKELGKKMKLKGKIAIVTGGSSGIGAAISHALAKEGATVIIVNKHNPDAGGEVAKQIIQNGGVAKSILCDVSDNHEVTVLTQQVIKDYKRIDILVHCAATLIFKNLEETTLDEWDFVLNTNLKSAFILSKAITPHMKRQKYGKIIFISSIAAIRGVASTSAYSASKGGVLAMTRSMVAEFAHYGINVNIITPGATATPMNQELCKNSHFMKQIKPTPSGIIMMQAEDIASSAVYLASEDAKNIHGLDLIVDSGVAAVQ